MIEHKMDIDPSYQELQEQLNGMQKIQITQEIVANEEKEQKIEERQPKTTEEQKQKDITAKETHEIEENFQNRYSFENWKETNSAKERLEQIEKLPYAKEQNIKDFGSIDKWLENVYNMAKKETPHQIATPVGVKNPEGSVNKKSTAIEFKTVPMNIHGLNLPYFDLVLSTIRPMIGSFTASQIRAN